MSQRRWFNPNVPQTLYVAQFLLYFDAFWMALAVLFGRGLGVLGLIALAAYVFGAYGIATEQKRGYQVAVVAAFLPLALRTIAAVLVGDGLIGDLGYILTAGNILNVIFEYALIALLLHPMSREHQKIWFR
jgi:hypothetical protein